MNPWPPQPMTEAGETCHLCWIPKASQRTFKEASERSVNTPILSSAWCRINFNTLKIKMQQQFYVEMLLKLPSLMILCSSHRKKNNLITYCWCLLILLIRKKKVLGLLVVYPYRYRSQSKNNSDFVECITWSWYVATTFKTWISIKYHFKYFKQINLL